MPNELLYVDSHRSCAAKGFAHGGVVLVHGSNRVWRHRADGNGLRVPWGCYEWARDGIVSRQT